MKKTWTDEAWEEYIYWQMTDKKIARRINQLIKDIDRNGNSGIGKPEPLKHDLNGFWSRRIDEKHRLVYSIEPDTIIIVQCKLHYNDN